MKNILYTIILSFLFSSAYAGMTDQIKNQTNPEADVSLDEYCIDKTKEKIKLRPDDNKYARLVFMRNNSKLGWGTSRKQISKITINKTDTYDTLVCKATIVDVLPGIQIIDIKVKNYIDRTTFGKSQLSLTVDKGKTYFIDIAIGSYSGKDYALVGLFGLFGALFVDSSDKVKMIPVNDEFAKKQIERFGYEITEVENNILPKEETAEVENMIDKDSPKNKIDKDASGNDFEKLRELNKLYKEGVLTEEEFNVKKKELLERM